jgi:hypothetical protein
MYEFPIGKTTLYGNCPEGCKECNVDPKDWSPGDSVSCDNCLPGFTLTGDMNCVLKNKMPRKREPPDNKGLNYNYRR